MVYSSEWGALVWSGIFVVLASSCDGPTKPDPDGYPADFCTAFDAYPADGRKNPAKALKRWLALPEDVRAEVPAAIERYKRKLVEKDHKVKWFEGFLNPEYLENYLSDGGVPKATTSGPKSEPWAHLRERSDDDWRREIQSHALPLWNVTVLGPAPAHKDCLVPKHLIDEMNLADAYDADGLAINTNDPRHPLQLLEHLEVADVRH